MIRTHINYIVPPQQDGCSAEQFLRMQGFSHRLLVRIKSRSDGLLLDGVPVHMNIRLHSGQCLTAALAQAPENDWISPICLPLSIVFEDADIIVIDKPAGMPVHPSQGHHDDTAANGLAYHYLQLGEPFLSRPIGRLDRDTSGLMLFARNELSACILSKHMRNRQICREYRAVCTGTLPEHGVIRSPIARAEGSTLARTVDAHGEPAVTHYQRLICTDNYSLAAVQLETGRTHQIRVHMKSIGHPLPGDFLYYPDYSRISRQALHAHRLTFSHPITGCQLSFTVPMPYDMQQFFP